MPMPQVQVQPERVEPSMYSSNLGGGNGVGTDVPPLLVVDESDTDSPELASLLEARGYRVVAAGSGGEAIEMIRHAKPALAVVADGANRRTESGRRLAEF